KFFLALAFLGGSAAVQAGDGRRDVPRIDFGKTTERLDDANGWGHALGEEAHANVSMCTLYSPPDYGTVTGTHNGVPVS
ncbi:hypothetical protein RA265_29985, partial [Pseudomonas syringae pv. tagetis]|uniref:hypothetical protein n=1 Tax=Pseudomonas syringae group genomosp. 7 TaxID=251699 RepID=UPI00377052A7